MSPRALRVGTVVAALHFGLTALSGGLALLLRGEEAGAGIEEPTLLTHLMLLVMGLFSFPAQLVVPQLLSPEEAARWTWLILLLNSLTWGVAGGTLYAWWHSRRL